MALGKLLQQIPDDHTGGVRPYKRGQKRPEWLERVDVVDFLTQLDVNNLSQATVDEMAFSCPFSGHAHGDEDASAYMNTGAKDKAKTTVFKCHGCGRAGNAITFLAEHEDITKGKAAQWLRQEFASDYRAPKGGSISAEFEKRYGEHVTERERGPDEIPTIAWELYHDSFGVDWAEAGATYDDDDCPMAVAYMFDRGFLPSTLEAWGIGYDTISERVAIPVADPEGNLVGVKGRTWKRKLKPKYKIIGDKEGRRPRYGFAPYEKSRVVFGIDKIKRMTMRKLLFDGAVVCEGEIDVMALWQLDIPAISTGSAHLSDAQGRLIRSHFDEVVVWFDLDKAGVNAVRGYEDKDGVWHPGLIEKLEPFIKVRLVGDHDDDPAKMLETGKVKRLEKLIQQATPTSKLIMV